MAAPIARETASMQAYELFKDLMVMAIADGKLTEEELRMLAGRAIRWGISNEQFEQAMEYALSDEAHVTIPPDPEDRTRLLEELLRMMAVDGQLAEIEKQIFAVVAATMKVGDRELNELLDRMLKD